MTAKIAYKIDSYTRRGAFHLQCQGVLNGTLLGFDCNEAVRSIHEINIRREQLGLPAITVVK